MVVDDWEEEPHEKPKKDEEDEDEEEGAAGVSCCSFASNAVRICISSMRAARSSCVLACVSE